ncbi:MAG TPA: hypothetical protein DCZ84_00850 [Candidatus Vogelbacteria bacterium]|uniref:Nudix hydrolase domain-containing protein n=1 Tax=Candidatus Vogelbacteria bacterium RIFOXYD1_FULL_51_18 TaxID=1802440 RepID=A0A1G2QJA2_9BACT|nr:MAG: hypothetical protein UY66_C0004G0006 [Parcubacteria group bacterium GW2011_GWC1_51_35]KKW25974.1 MAG: hypothetical protein UY68_C0002G0029 [Parcubacteria group bacterium GW2011_GWF2_52_12]KKW27374.1 MAG: hypothetical protein UY69_C0014G0024 [Parcubacteria group bacterium GW2011_GWF1_52_5]OHA60616.1 MAG: hypothetical protein A2569_00890 [Candidatus Vogelbacteria bacterium RIFOXYD1_FULL_51_18]HBB65173.1 hypothetical protein [Candidatus Vogelbacteria bacterium]
MPSSSLSPEEQAELGHLLAVVVEQDKGFIPDSAYRFIHKLVPWPAVEVLIYDDGGRFLLSHRDDDFKGWHIPGGYMKPGQSYQDACDYHVRKEGIADGVSSLELIGTHTWLHREHPFGYPISLIIACRATSEVTERDDLKWFTENPPDVIPQNVPRYLAYFQKWFKGDRESAAIL